MFRIRRDIIFSAMVHSILLAVALLIGGSSEIRKANLLSVLLFDDKDIRLPGKQTPAADRRQDLQTSAISGTAAKTVPEIAPISEITQEQTASAVTPANPQQALLSDSYTGVTGIQAQSSALSAGRESRGSVSSQTFENSGRDATTASISRGLTERETEDREDPSLKQIIRGTLQNNLVYPYMARKRRMEGTVLVDFRINRKGVAENVRVVKGSGFALLDSAAMQTVVRSSPFPLANYSIEVPITYQLSQN